MDTLNQEQELLNIASTHLGKRGGDGYKTIYDPSLLVRIPRSINRNLNGIDAVSPGFSGTDVWNAYEVSALTQKGLPVACIAKIILPALSTYHVESKSLKLYLNSFNMTRIGADRSECLCKMRSMIEADLSSLLECEVLVALYTDCEMVAGDRCRHGQIPAVNTFEKFTDILDLIPSDVLDSMEFNDYSSNASLLTADSVQAANDGSQSGANGQPVRRLRVKSDLLRSNCRVTHQPDWGTVYIDIESDTLPTAESLLRYIISHRTVFHFHEEICEMIYKHLHDLCHPSRLTVACCYTRRGGIDINPIRTSHQASIPSEFTSTDLRLAKTLRQ